MPKSIDEQLREELETTIKDCTVFAKRSYIWAQTLFLITILASFFSSIFIAGGLGERLFGAYYKEIIAILAALPGTALLINNSLRFEERTKWFWKKVRITEKLRRQLRYSSNPNIEEISSTFSEKMEELESEWPAMDAPVQQPKKP